jgi:hypothetical protein
MVPDLNLQGKRVISSTKKIVNLAFIFQRERAPKWRALDWKSHAMSSKRK